jgi:hypothetical protein
VERTIWRREICIAMRCDFRVSFLLILSSCERFSSKNTQENPTFSRFFWVAAQTLMDVGSEVWKFVE